MAHLLQQLALILLGLAVLEHRPVLDADDGRCHVPGDGWQVGPDLAVLALR